MKYKILLVEDVKVAQKIATLTLSELNCSVDIAETGKETLNLIAQNEYDLVLMDLGLGDMDGFVITEEIRKMKNPKSELLIIALTAHVNEDIKSRCHNVGINDFISKPIKIEDATYIFDKYLHR